MVPHHPLLLRPPSALHALDPGLFVTAAVQEYGVEAEIG